MQPEASATPPPAASRYAYDIDTESDTTAAKVVELVGRDKRVLELGCTTGHMSRVLVERGCEVVAIEIDADAAAEASEPCERVIVGDLEQLDLARELDGDSFDVMLAADVLEHLKDPPRVLLSLRRFLRSDGYLALSVPNVVHGSVRLAVLGGEFPYADLGLLDRTHLRFYTHSTLEDMLGEGGFALEHLDRQSRELEGSEVPFDAERLPPGLVDALGDDPEALTYQFVARARPVGRDRQPRSAQAAREAAEQRLAAAESASRARRSVERQLDELRGTQGEAIEGLEATVADVASRMDGLDERSAGAEARGDERHAALLTEQATLAARYEELASALLVLLEDDSTVEENTARDEERIAAEHQRWYTDVVERTRAAVRASVPKRARVAVISKGDDELLQLEGREAWHFPQTDTGLYAGFYPEDGTAAVAHLEGLRGKGADFLVIPASAIWWLDHYPELREHLDATCRLVADDPSTCLIYSLRVPAGAQGPGRDEAELAAAQTAPQVGAWLDVLLPPKAGLVAIGEASALLEPGERRVWRLPAVDGRRPGSLAETLRGVDEAAVGGARFAVLTHAPGRRQRGASEGLRQGLLERSHPVARQLLGEVFELSVAGAQSARTEPFEEGEYRRVKEELRVLVERRIPTGAKILVVSKGDDDLLHLGDREAHHFLEGEGRAYAGHHPADSAQALRALEEMRSQGAEYLVLPASSLWWLDYYRDLAAHLERRSTQVIREDACRAFDLVSAVDMPTPRGRPGPLRGWRKLRRALQPGSNNLKDRSHDGEA
jgi:2-polyprenyl-3-methyl-5-hydroxy-6-metoxy-1,4-benzoquinol methylase